MRRVFLSGGRRVWAAWSLTVLAPGLTAWAQDSGAPGWFGTADLLRCGRLSLWTAQPGPSEGAGGSTDVPAGSATASEQDLAEVGKKLANPVSDVWALFTEFDLFFSDGDASAGEEEVGGRMVFQPVLPVKLYGHGSNEWKLISRPSLPIVFSQPVPEAVGELDHLGGLGDLQLPTLLAPPTGQLLFGVGPAWLFPTATRTELGRQQWGVGPSMVLGYANKDFTVAVFPQYFFGIGGWGSKPDASYLSMLYAFVYNLPDAWQIGMNPTITYDHRADSRNRWNVPVGLFVGKTLKIGSFPVKLQLGVEYSVVRQDDFGQRAQIKLNVIPVIPALIGKPVFGGGE